MTARMKIQKTIPRNELAPFWEFSGPNITKPRSLKFPFKILGKPVSVNRNWKNGTLENNAVAAVIAPIDSTKTLKLKSKIETIAPLHFITESRDNITDSTQTNSGMIKNGIVDTRNLGPKLAPPFHRSHFE
jgi:hypothetical protein